MAARDTRYQLPGTEFKLVSHAVGIGPQLREEEEEEEEIPAVLC